MGGNQHSSTDVAALRCRSCLLEGVRHMTRRARTCCVVIRTGGARRWSVCIPKESKVVVSCFLWSFSTIGRTRIRTASLPHWAGRIGPANSYGPACHAPPHPRSTGHCPARGGRMPSLRLRGGLVRKLLPFYHMQSIFCFGRAARARRMLHTHVRDSLTNKS